MSRDPYVTKCLDSIQEHYFLVKPVPYYPGNAWYGIKREILTTLLLSVEAQSRSSESETSSSHENISILRSKLRIVKHAPSEQDHNRFATQKLMYNDLLSYWRTEKWIVPPWDFNDPGQLPYLVFPFSMGGSLDLYLEKLASSKTRVPEGFMWHIVHSVLSAILEIRFEYPDHTRKPVAHNAITTRAVIIDPHSTSHAYPCYPDIKLTDFESAEYLPAPDLNSHGPNHDPQMANDIWGVRKLLHDLAHEKHLARDPQTWGFGEGPRGGCLCELITFPDGHFNLQDRNYMQIYMVLGDAFAHCYAKEHIIEILNKMDMLRRAATLTAFSHSAVRPSDPAAWDIRKEILPDHELKELIDRMPSQEQHGEQCGLGISRS